MAVALQDVLAASIAGAFSIGFSRLYAIGDRAKEAIGEYLLEAQTSWKAISDNYRSANPPLEPTVALVVDAGSLEFTLMETGNWRKGKNFSLTSPLIGLIDRLIGA